MILAPNVHFVGIGGIGMSGLAKVLLEAGYQVSGCDRQRSHITDKLADMGVTIYEGHSADHLGGTDLLVISSAIPEENPELREAQRREIPVVKRAELLGHLMKGRQGVAVAGTHGKTTTTGMIAWIIEQAGFDPTIFAGGELVNLGTNAKRGQGAYVVAEADEYDYAFLELAPVVAVLTNVEADHPDIFEDLDAVVDAFAAFLDRVQPAGQIIACADDARVQRLIEQRDNTITYGLTQPAEWEARGLGYNDNSQTFTVRHNERPVGEFQVRLPGRHNVSNALAAIAATSIIGIDPNVIREALAGFLGTHRRFEKKGSVDEITVIDDYAHHPTEIQATLAAARQWYPERTLWAVFQPHTYSRTQALLEDFAASFDDADHVVVTDIYAAREGNTLGMHAEHLVQQMHHPGAQHIAALEDAAGYLVDHLAAGDIVVTLGAGDVWQLGERVLELLAHPQAVSSGQ